MKHNILFINLIEPLHNGAGEGLGSIDRPIIRETPTSFPLIQPSSIKGVLRNHFSNIPGYDEEKLYALFGPESGNVEDHAGAISFGEGQLLAFPVRSLKGLFVWATCPRILFRLQQRLHITGKINLQSLDKLLDCIKTQGETFEPLVTKQVQDDALINNHLILEEFSYRVNSLDSLGEFAFEIASLIYQPESYWAKQFSNKLIILPEDSFRYYIENSTEIMPNIKIEDNGVTKDGSLRYTEYLPRESVLYSLISYNKSRRSTVTLDEDNIQSELESNNPGVIQIGGDETTGKGLVELRMMSLPTTGSKQ